MTMNWQPKTVAVWQAWYSGHYRAYKRSFYDSWHLTYKGELIATLSDLQEIMKEAELHMEKEKNND